MRRRSTCVQPGLPACRQRWYAIHQAQQVQSFTWECRFYVTMPLSWAGTREQMENYIQRVSGSWEEMNQCEIQGRNEKCSCPVYDMSSCPFRIFATFWGKMGVWYWSLRSTVWSCLGSKVVSNESAQIFDCIILTKKAEICAKHPEIKTISGCFCKRRRRESK